MNQRGSYQEREKGTSTQAEVFTTTITGEEGCSLLARIQKEELIPLSTKENGQITPLLKCARKNYKSSVNLIDTLSFTEEILIQHSGKKSETGNKFSYSSININ